MSQPYLPQAFSTPAINPAVGGYGLLLPYISTSMYIYAPTAMSTSSLVPGGNAAQQTQALADTIRRASRWADRYLFGTDPAGKGASLAATLTVQSSYTQIINNELRLYCDYRPIMELVGLEIGYDPSSTSPYLSSASTSIRFGSQVIYVPIAYGVFNATVYPTVVPMGSLQNGRRMYSVWSYVNGYPHTSLAANATAGSTTLTLTSTGGTNGGLLGVYPNTTFEILDGANTESVTIASVTNGIGTSTVTLTSPLLYSHTVPTAPDFIPVTAIPDDVTQAIIFLTTALIKTRGDFSLTLDEMTAPTKRNASVGDIESDVAYALEFLEPYRIRTKGGLF